MSDLAQRLVRETAQAIYGAAYGKATKRKAERAVVAVLRELASWCDEDIQQCLKERTDWEPLGPSDLRAWADSIEKGGQGG